MSKPLARMNREIVLFGFHVNEIMAMPFGEIERRLNCKVRVDSEVSVVFAGIDKDLLPKSDTTRKRDHVASRLDRLKAIACSGVS